MDIIVQIMYLFQDKSLTITRHSENFNETSFLTNTWGLGFGLGPYLKKDFMKYLLTVLALTLVISCKDKKPDVVIEPQPTPVVVEPPVSKEHCSPEGKHFACGNPVWYKLPKCGPGDADGTAYFMDSIAIKDAAAKGGFNSCIQIKMKSGDIVPVSFGFGPCVTCLEL